MARDKYSTGFSISTPDMENELNEIRNSPELIATIRESNRRRKRDSTSGGTASIATGRYACGKMAGVAGSMQFQARPDILILEGGKYKNLNSQGTFSYDSDSHPIA